MHVDSLSIEVTRRCNIKCAHCLRGGAQRKDLDLRHVSKLFALRDIDSIGCLCLSGGEPSLVPNIISGISYALGHYKIDVNYFYIATNGTHVTEDFIRCIRYLCGVVDDPECCQIQVSMDPYHKTEDPRRRAFEGLCTLRDELGDTISVSDRNNLSDRSQFFSVIGEGRARSNQISFTPVANQKITLLADGAQLEGSLYLNAEGWLIDGGDYSYVSQKKHKLFHVNDAIDCSLAASLGYASIMYGTNLEERDYANA